MALNASQIAVRDGPLARAGLRNTGQVADCKTTCFINVHGIDDIGSFAKLKTD